MQKRILVAILILVIVSGHLVAEVSSVFPKGEIATVDNHTGTVWLRELSEHGSIFNYSIADATFTLPLLQSGHSLY